MPFILQTDISDTKVSPQKRKPAMLLKPNATRWGSDFDMMRRVYRLMVPFRTTCAQFNIDLPTLDWAEAYLRIMEPIRLVTVKIQQERVPTLGFATFQLKTLTLKFAQIRADPASVQWLQERNMLAYFDLLRQELVQTLAHYKNDLSYLALYLDPCFKAMNEPRFKPEDRARARDLYIAAYRSEYPPQAQPPAPVALDLDADFDAPTQTDSEAESMHPPPPSSCCPSLPSESVHRSAPCRCPDFARR
jgi:hypothetical protein